MFLPVQNQTFHSFHFLKQYPNLEAEYIRFGDGALLQLYDGEGEGDSAGGNRINEKNVELWYIFALDGEYRERVTINGVLAPLVYYYGLGVSKFCMHLPLS